MRTLPVLSLGALALALAAPTIAAPEGKPAGPDRSVPMARADTLAKVEARFAKIDTNSDGVIDAAEMTAHREAKRAARAEKIAAMTDEQKAKFQERRAAMKERWAKRAASTDAPAVKRSRGDRMARIDMDGDGRITAAEFAAPAMQRFDKMDANSDGIVTPDERKAARAARRAARG